MKGRIREKISRRPANIRNDCNQMAASGSTSQEPNGPTAYPKAGPMLERDDTVSPKASRTEKPISNMQVAPKKSSTT